MFRKFKSELNKYYVQKGLTTDFEHEFQNQRAFWDDFVAFKRSESATKASEANKAIRQKNVHPHLLGTGGYIKKNPMWDQREQSLIASCVAPETADWQPRSKHWLFGRGATLSDDGHVQCRNPQEQEVAQKIAEAHDLSSQGSFNPDKEKDELTLALGNKEHPGRIRGVGMVN